MQVELIASEIKKIINGNLKIKSFANVKTINTFARTKKRHLCLSFFKKVRWVSG